MFCPQCGNPALDRGSFCNHCGTALASGAAPSGQPVPLSAAPAGGAAGRSASEAAAAASSERGFARVKNILLSPSTEWRIIAAEPSSPSALYVRYAAPLLAIGVIATFIGRSMAGLPFEGRVGLAAALAHAAIAYALAFLGVYLVALIIDLLAPSFGAERDSLAALKVTVYSFTPGWVAGVFSLIPALGVLAIIGAAYGLYLLYLGLPILMRCPAEKSAGYVVVTAICAIATWAVIAALTNCGVGGLGLEASVPMSRVDTPTVASPGEASAAVPSRILGDRTAAERAGDGLRTLENPGGPAQKAAAATAAGPAESKPVDVEASLAAVGPVVSGDKEGQTPDLERLAEMLPEALPGMQRLYASGSSDEAMGVEASRVTARYSDGRDASIVVEIADTGSRSGLTALAARFDPGTDRETDTGYARRRRVDGHLVHERYDRAARSGELSILLANRYAVTVRGRGVSAEALAGALARIDVTRLGSAGRQ